MNDIKSYINKQTGLIEKKLKEIFLPLKETQPILYDPVVYSLSSGKKLRPMLLLATVATLRGDSKKALIPACAIELIHTYSLIHDDLPCMDDDNLRRGKPSLHRAFPQWLALLTGDYFLTRSFEIISSDKEITDSQKIKIIQILSQKAGDQGMIGGQVLDLANSGKQMEWECLKNMHKQKTGELFLAAIQIGAILANASNEEINKLKRFAIFLGLAFQINDDILDDTSSEQILGKPIGSDKKKNKPTALSLLGLKKAKTYLEELTQKALKELKSIGANNSLLENLLLKTLYIKF
jgi:geranylgeranyl pyrophosphate synthase